MDSNKRPKFLGRLGLLALIVLGAFGLSFLGCFPWSGLNCFMLEVDIESGRTRTTRSLFWLPVRRAVADTAFTRALKPEDLNEPSDWRPVSLTSPGVRHSPHFVFHAAAWQVRELELIWGMVETPVETRRAQALEVRRLWRERGNDSNAGEYLASLLENLPPS